MIILISQIIFALSALVILVIILRKVPVILRYPRSPFEETSIIQTIKQKADASHFFHERIIPKIEKILRKIKIIVLKFDNFLAKRVDRLRDKIKRREKEKDLPS